MNSEKLQLLNDFSLRKFFFDDVCKQLMTKFDPGRVTLQFVKSRSRFLFLVAL